MDLVVFPQAYVALARVQTASCISEALKSVCFMALLAALVVRHLDENHGQKAMSSDH